MVNSQCFDKFRLTNTEANCGWAAAYMVTPLVMNVQLQMLSAQLYTDLTTIHSTNNMPRKTDAHRAAETVA